MRFPSPSPQLHNPFLPPVNSRNLPSLTFAPRVKVSSPAEKWPPDTGGKLEKNEIAEFSICFRVRVDAETFDAPNFFCLYGKHQKLWRLE